MSYDNACKYLSEKYPMEFARWLLSVEPQQVEVLKTELTLEPIRADSLTFLRTDNRILHIEFQTLPKSKPPLDFRTLDYSVRLKRQYKCSVTQIIIFLKETDNEVVFQEEFRDETTIHRYHVIRMWEQDSALFLNNPALLPLAPLTHTDSPSTLLAQVTEKIAKIPNREERQNIAGCTEILAGLKFEKDVIRQFLREDIMQESVIYQDILQKGKKQEAVKWITSFLNYRFGEVNSSLIAEIQVLSLQKLEDLRNVLFSFPTLADLEVWLKQQ
jgi:predicted transposase YdaD